MNKKVIVSILVLLVLFVGISSADIIHTDKFGNTISGEEKKVVSKSINWFEKIYKLFMKKSLPQSLDKQYVGSVPEKMSSPYLLRMFGLGGLFEAIVINSQNGDTKDAIISYNAFAKEYKTFAKDVPEWEDYFDIKTVDKLGNDLKTGSSADIFGDIGKIGASCTNCHKNVQPQVWAKYYWKDFDTVNVKNPAGVDIPWVDGMKALAMGFDGIGVNSQQGNKKGAEQSFSLFKTMLYNFKDACSNCHDSPRYYFVSQTELSKIDEIGTDINSGNLAQAKVLQEQFGENCYKCHVIHIPAQDMKAELSK